MAFSGVPSYRVNFQSASTGQGTFPLGVFLVFTDGSNLQLVNDNLSLAPGQQRRLGPFPAVPGSTGFSYRVSVEGCN